MRLALALLPLLAGCGDRSCPAVLANASAQPVEQFYVAPAGTVGWGEDQVKSGDLAPGASQPIRFPHDGNYAVRAVWANGRAAEMPGVAACRTRRVTVRDGALQAE